MTRRTLHVGGRQGRGDPPLAHSEPDEGPGMVLSPFVWSAGVLCAALWAAFLWVVFA